MDAGVVQFQKQTYQNLAHGDFAALAGSRHSLRIFGDEAVKEDAVFSALEIARKTPSACNRQPWHVYWVRTPEAKNKLLEIQSGHRGFGAGADSFLIVTADIQSYFGVVERHQTFIDGGLYAMSLLYALHYAGLGACPLNWCVAFKTDMKLRNMFAIPDSENVIMIIAIGTLPQEIKAAKSLRKSVVDTVRSI
jgi:nitroreductase